MLEIFQNFESAVGTPAKLNPAVLIGPGLAAVLLGLFIWLGGMGFRRLLAATIGLVTGAICGFFIAGRNGFAAVALAVLTLALAIVFQRIFIALLAAALATAFAFAVLAKPYIQNNTTPIYINQDTNLNVQDSIETAKIFALDFANIVKQTGQRMPLRCWAIIVGLGLVLLLAGIFLRRITSAWCCAALGTVLIFAGMIFLLLYKGSTPVSIICGKTSFYLAVFIAMTVFGTIEQLLLCPWTIKPPARKKQNNKNDEQDGRTRQRWRGR